MDIALFGIKMSVELIILIVLIYLVMSIHTLCGCSKVGLMEGLQIMNKRA
jgi:hypothetical protein